MAIRLLTPGGVQTLCQQPRAAGVLVFSHGCQPRPDAVRGACAALGPWRKRVNRVSRRARPGAGGASTLPTGWSDRGGQRAPRSDPMTSLQVQRSRRRRPHRSCPLSRNACGPPRWRPDAPRARPAQTTVHPAPPQALAGAHGETRVWHALVDGGRLHPRLACPPVGRVPTYRQRVLGTAPLGAAHRRTALLLGPGRQAQTERPHALAWYLLCSEGMGS